MNVSRFVAERTQSWNLLENLVAKARGRPERLSATEVLDLGARYRAVVADLARLRQHAPGDPSVLRLEKLAVESRGLVYRFERPRREPFGFFTTRYWQLIASRPMPLAASALLLLGPALLVASWALLDPEAAVGLVPDEFQSVLDPGPAGTDQGLTTTEQAAFSSFLISHNVQVSIFAFGAGIFWCLGAAYVLISNGTILGAIGGLLVERGSGAFFVELVAAHGVLELSAIVVTAAAGLRMGWALVSPGRLTRRAALVAQARESVQIVLGTIPWFVVAGIIEAFVSRRGLAAIPMATVGAAVGIAYWALVLARGRSEPELTPEPAP